MTRPKVADLCRELGLETPGKIGGALSAADLLELFKVHPKGVHFWVATVFHEVIERVPPERCFRFWKREVKPHLLEAPWVFYREVWPGGYAYVAQEWRSPFRQPLIELQKGD